MNPLSKQTITRPAIALCIAALKAGDHNDNKYTRVLWPVRILDAERQPAFSFRFNNLNPLLNSVIRLLSNISEVTVSAPPTLTKRSAK